MFGQSFLILIAIVAYLGWRLLVLLDGTRQRVLFSIAFALIALLLPLTEFLAHSSSMKSPGPLIRWGYMSLPFLFYLFLAVLLSDILRGLNRLLKLVPPATLKSQRARRIILAVLVGVPIVAVAAGRINYGIIRVNEYSIQIPRKASTLENLRIALASDFHLREMTDPDFMSEFVQRVNSLQADVLLLPGDLLEGDRKDEQLAEFEQRFREIRTTYGIFGSLGNHENHGMSGKMEFFRGAGIAILEDTSVTVDHSFTLIGRNDYRLQRRKSMDRLMNEAPPDLPVIVMDHKPTDLDAVTRAGPAIHVSGHTHNGQLWPLNYVTERIYDLSWGYRQMMETHVFVTSGIQLWGPPVRTTGDSEIMLIKASLK